MKFFDYGDYFKDMGDTSHSFGDLPDDHWVFKKLPPLSPEKVMEVLLLGEVLEENVEGVIFRCGKIGEEYFRIDDAQFKLLGV